MSLEEDDLRTSFCSFLVRGFASLRSRGAATHGLRKDFHVLSFRSLYSSPRSRNLQRHPVGPESTAYLYSCDLGDTGAILWGLNAFGCATLLRTSVEMMRLDLPSVDLLV